MSKGSCAWLCPLSFFLPVPLLILSISGCGSSQQPLPISVAISPQAAAIATGQTAHLTATVTNDSTGVNWSATTGSIAADGTYTAPSGSQSATVLVTAISKRDPTKSASATVNVVAPGQVSPTANVQVALYSISPVASANVSVQFGVDTNYGLTTWTQPVPSGGGAVSLFVAGMKANTLYHLRGIVAFSDGSQYTDADLTFTTGTIPAAEMPVIAATTTAGMTPQSGVELLDLVGGSGSVSPLVVADLSGNILWNHPGHPPLIPNPIKLLPNGHFLINFSAAGPDGANSILQELDLTGAVVWQMTHAELQTALASATCGGDGCDLSNFTFLGTHHDFELLPNGHLIVLGAIQSTQVVPGITVTGDVVIDLDQNHKPVWLWNAFDHLDVARRPMLFPDWTHSNAVIYSADDGNLIVSVRHQNWLLKLDYNNGAGTANVIWKLGYQGDFALVGGTDPTDWFYAQHGPSLTTTNTTGQFSLILFDNGNDRVFPAGVTCGTAGAPPCTYSTVPLLQIDETAKTAAITFHPDAKMPFSIFGGNAAVMKSGSVEYCESAGGPGIAGQVYEVTQDNSAQVIWNMLITGKFVYRGQRIPSLYPGVQW